MIWGYDEEHAEFELRIPTKPISHSDLMPITYGAKRRRALSVWNSDRHPSTVFCFSSQLLHSFFALSLGRGQARSAAAEGGGRSPPVLFVFSFIYENAVGKWETCFWFSTFPRRSRRSCGNVGISPAFGEISKGLWKEGKTCFWFSTLSIAPPFPQLSSSAFHFSPSLPPRFLRIDSPCNSIR